MRTKFYDRRLISLFPAAIVAAGLGLATACAQTAPSLTQQPASQTVVAGSNAAFSVAVTGTGPLAYQWRFNGANLPTIIITAAGNGAQNFSGDGGPATNASLDFPGDVCADRSGNLFIADTYNYRVRKVGANGLITTVAGNGAQGFPTDGQLATNVSLEFPEALCVDSSGNLFIADDQIIRKVDTNGILTTVPGNGAGLAADAFGDLFIAGYTADTVSELGTNGLLSTVAGDETNGYSGDGGAATNASLDTPTHVAVDASGNLFIADWDNYRVRKVDTNGLISTVAGNGTNGYSGDGGPATNASLSQPSGVAVDAFGNLFIADEDNARLRKVDTNGLITTVAGNGTNGDAGDGGPATNGSIGQVNGIAVDAPGNLFIADTVNNRIREVPVFGPTLLVAGISATNAGAYDVVVTSPSGSVTSSVAVLTVAYPPGVAALPQTEIAFLGSNVTLSVPVTGSPPLAYHWQFNGSNLPNIIVTVAGNGSNGFSGDGGPAANAGLFAGGVAVDALGDLFIVDGANNRIREAGFNGLIDTVAGNGSPAYSGDGGPATNASLFDPRGVAVDAAGDIFIADTGNNCVREVGTNGLIATVAGNGTNGYFGDGGNATNASLSNPAGVAVDAFNNLFIADKQNNRVLRVDTNGIITTVAGNGTNGYFGDGGAATNASLSNPAGVALDASGNLLIADGGNHRVRRVGTNGIITTVAGTGAAGYYGDGGKATNAFLETPVSVAVDLSGNLIIADTTEHVRIVGTNGIIATLIGNAGYGYSGDGGPPTNAELSDVYGVAVDGFGNLFIADTGNNRVRRVGPPGPTLLLNNVSAGDDGPYDLVVSNAYGSVTSAVVTLTVDLPPLSASLAGGRAVRLQFSGAAGANYVLQTATNLAPPITWQPLFTNAAASNGNWTFTDTNTSAAAARFYRLSTP